MQSVEFWSYSSRCTLKGFTTTVAGLPVSVHCADVLSQPQNAAVAVRANLSRRNSVIS